MDTNMKMLGESLRQACEYMLQEVAKMVEEYGNPYSEDSGYYLDYLGIDQTDVQMRDGGDVRVDKVIDLQREKPARYAMVEKQDGDLEVFTLLGVFTVISNGVAYCWMAHTRRNVTVADDEGDIRVEPVRSKDFDQIRSVYRLLRQACVGEVQE